jgi:FkbM family methyltransferase
MCIPNKGILHIGAHICEEKSIYNMVGIDDSNILWIEGNPDLIPKDSINNIIQAVISNKDNEEVNFNITNNMQSSSILNLKTHAIEHPNITVIETRKLETITLDTLFRNHNIPYDKYDFINLDIQGAELLALQGATKILPNIKAIYTEVNEKELYEGCCLLPDLENFLSINGFERTAISMTQHGWGDALYMRKNI